MNGDTANGLGLFLIANAVIGMAFNAIFGAILFGIAIVYFSWYVYKGGASTFDYEYEMERSHDKQRELWNEKDNSDEIERE